MKMHGGVEACFHNLSSAWGWLVFFMPWLLYPLGESPLYPLNKRLGGLQGWSGHCGAKKNLLFLPRIEPQFLGCLVHSLIPIPIGLENSFMRYEIFTVVKIHTVVFQMITPYSLVSGYRCSKWTYCLYFHFCAQDRDSTFVHNDGKHLPDYTMS
jgi:hypothetical protein